MHTAENVFPCSNSANPHLPFQTAHGAGLTVLFWTKFYCLLLFQRIAGRHLYRFSLHAEVLTWWLDDSMKTWFLLKWIKWLHIDKMWIWCRSQMKACVFTHINHFFFSFYTFGPFTFTLLFCFFFFNISSLQPLLFHNAVRNNFSNPLTDILNFFFFFFFLTRSNNEFFTFFSTVSISTDTFLTIHISIVINVWFLKQLHHILCWQSPPVPKAALWKQW